MTSNRPNEAKPSQPASPALKIVTTLDGENVSKSIVEGTAITIAEGGSAKVVVKVKRLRRIQFNRAIRVRLSATSQADPSISASATATINLKASK